MNSWVDVEHMRLCTSDSGFQPRKQVETCPTAGWSHQRKSEMRCWISGQIWMIDIIMSPPTQGERRVEKGRAWRGRERTWSKSSAECAFKKTEELAVLARAGRNMCRDRKEWPGCKGSSREDGTATSSGYYRGQGDSSVKKVM